MERRPAENQARAGDGHPTLGATLDAELAGSGGDADRGGRRGARAVEQVAVAALR